MDIQRPELMLRKRRRRSWWIGVTVSLVSATGIGVARMDPAMPTVQRSMLLVGTVERGEMLREVRGPGTLVPREIRWIAAETAARVERIVAKPGARVRPDGVILELVNPEVDEQLLAATAALTTAQSDAAARSTELSSRLYDAQAALEQARSGFEAARMQAEAEKDVADKGIIPAVQYRRSLVVLEQLRKRVDIEERRVLAFERSISAQVAGEQARLDQLAATRALRQRQVDGLRVRARRERRAAVEVIAAMDSAVLSFDADGRLDLANPAALRLIGGDAGERTVDGLGLARFLAADASRVVDHAFPGGSGRWEVRHARFRDNGRPHDLLVISDLGRALRDEERLAWQRLLRVLGHELNNSLAPIRSMADTLARLATRTHPPDERGDDLREGLQMIGDRAEALARFMARYTQLARLPPPRPRMVDFDMLARRVAALEQRIAISVLASPEARLHADPDQIEQALINLARNATDAALDGGGHVDIGWKGVDGDLLVEIRDDGPGLPPSDNLFVPFFTTKPGGSGIGLVLARQIAEAHGGDCTLEARRDMRGCIARLRLPLPPAA